MLEETTQWYSHCLPSDAIAWPALYKPMYGSVQSSLYVHFPPDELDCHYPFHVAVRRSQERLQRPAACQGILGRRF